MYRLIEARNVAIEGRFTMSDAAALREPAADLVRRRVAVIATPATLLGTLAAKAETKTIPIVFAVSVDPVQSGLVTSLNRPSGNLTGYTEANTEVWSKRLGLLRELAPMTTHFGVLDYPGNPLVANETRAAAEAAGLPIEIFSVSDDTGIEAAFSDLRRKGVDALLVSPGPFFFAHRNQIFRLAASHGVPVAYHLREYAEAGGLMSYGSSVAEGFRQVGIYTGRILKGARPAELPVVRPTKFELVINAKAAKALGLEIPRTLLAIVDEVIQ